MKFKWPVQMRKWHRWATVLVVLPFFIVLVSGLLLQVKKEFDWIQPPTQTGTGGPPQLAFDEILRIAGTVPEAQINSWADVDRLDVRPASSRRSTTARGFTIAPSCGSSCLRPGWCSCYG
jgi:uncharacterized iron-regulated membrane protein